MSTTKTYKDIFTLFDKKNEGKITQGQLGDFLRAVGYNPTNALVHELAGTSSSFTLNEIDQLVLENKQVLEATTQASVQDFMKAFQVFDKDGSGKISVGDLKYMLTGLGEKLNEDEVDEVLKGVESDQDGMIDYKKFVEDILKR
ncbi:hypothetical protein ACO0RG_003376 [Hanseniaspora osmophila]|uniref:Myosin light chain 1 n=1 Tax=Hanseniaspora osmophila TaxID=56408 RepID=A0A1E5RF68_9ASCO|nr:Myosin light chain 1 [Hanseniaspora osmophila]